MEQTAKISTSDSMQCLKKLCTLSNSIPVESLQEATFASIQAALRCPCRYR